MIPCPTCGCPIEEHDQVCGTCTAIGYLSSGRSAWPKPSSETRMLPFVLGVAAFWVIVLALLCLSQEGVRP